MNLDHSVAQHRTLIVEGCDGVGRDALLAGLARRHGYTVTRASPDLPHVDPVRPYRELLLHGGALAVDAGLVGELVYGPLRHGHSRVTWIQAFDFAEAVAERHGAFVHVTAPVPVLEDRLAARGASAAALAEIEAAVTGYDHAFSTLAEHAPVLTVEEQPVADDGPDPDPGHGEAAPEPPVSSFARPLPRIRSPVPCCAQRR
ncbi:hypothetical protein ADL28_26105 [Streptomyces violaceusniger]|nr:MULTISPECIES: hypothetical protein [Streptomyces]AJZ83699.1 hypothetical protein AS97_15105 [Streptomyces sp. AgN23]KUL50724.1 hypothetical protein ADL28_26105 [Streptomyces violaceusniger]WJD95712.1 hypothetical protein QR300_06725 [Streptomyces antimycoticus]